MNQFRIFIRILPTERKQLTNKGGSGCNLATRPNGVNIITLAKQHETLVLILANCGFLRLANGKFLFCRTFCQRKISQKNVQRSIPTKTKLSIRTKAQRSIFAHSRIFRDVTDTRL